MSSLAARPLTIFIAHPSELLTDHRPHGDGLVAFGFLSRLAARGHQLHIAAQVVDLRKPMPRNVHLYELLPGSRLSIADRLTFMVRMRALYRRLRRTVPFDLIHQMNPVFTGMSLVLIDAPTPLVLGTFVPTWRAEADALETRPRRTEGLKRTLLATLAGVQQARAAGLLIASPAARSRIVDPDRHEARIFEVPHGIDLSRFPERDTAPERPTVLFLANVIYRKGIFTLLDAFDAVASAVPDVELIIGGLGEQLDEVRARVAGMPGRAITVLGHVDRQDVPVMMRAHAVYCLPSYGEPFATSILEAMACGMPIVSTNTGGTPMLVSEAGGRLVSPRDPQALAAALIEVLASRELQRAMGRHNRRRVETSFELEGAVDRLEAAYASVLRQRAAAISATAGGAGAANTPAREARADRSSRTEPVRRAPSAHAERDLLR